MRRGLSCSLLAAVLAWSAGCDRSGPAATQSAAPAGTVVVYTALDRQFSEPILRAFTERTGINVEAVYDTESTKTVGLANRIRAEAKRPRCDVFWNNEILNTLRLKQEGLLQPCRPPEADNYPPTVRDPDGYWYGFAARARVILVNTELVPVEALPQSIRDLADSRWAGRAGIAKPLFGTTASHVASLFAVLGPEAARDLLLAWKANRVQVLSGNKTCAEAVGAGRLALGLTDTDDAMIEVQAGRPVRIVLPDAAPGRMGTLLLPNTLAVVKGAPNPAGAAKLIDYLLSPEVEALLAASPSAQIPLNSRTAARSRVPGLEALRPMQVDFAAAAQQFSAAADFVQREFLE